MNKKELDSLLYVFNINKDIWIKSKDLIEKLKYELCIIGGDDFVNEISESDLRKLIKELRQNGYLIIASNMGYKLSSNYNEIYKYVKSRWCELTREMKILKTLAENSKVIINETLGESEIK